MLLSISIWLAIGAGVGAIAHLFAPQNSYGWSGDIAISIAGAIAGGLIWPAMRIYLSGPALNAAVGGAMGVSLILPALRMLRPDLIAFLYPERKPPA